MTPTPPPRLPYDHPAAAASIGKAIRMLMVRYALSLAAATDLLHQLALDIETHYLGAAQAVVAEADDPP